METNPLNQMELGLLACPHHQVCTNNHLYCSSYLLPILYSTIAYSAHIGKDKKGSKDSKKTDKLKVGKDPRVDD